LILKEEYRLKVAENFVQKSIFAPKVVEQQRSENKFNDNNYASRLLYRNVNIKIYRTIVLPVVLYRCKIWSLILRDRDRA
jgi:hypothetical protein